MIAKGAGILFAGNIVGSGLRYLFLMVAARHMDLVSFGLFSLGFAVFTVTEVFASFGMNRGVLRFVPIYQAEEDWPRLKGTLVDVVRVSTASGCFVGIALIVLSGFLSREVFHAPELRPMLQVFGLTIPFSALSTVFLSATQGIKIMQYKVYVKDLMEPTLRLVSALIMFYVGYKLWGAFLSVAFSIVSGGFFGYFFYRKTFSFILRNNVQAIHEIKKLTTFVWPLFLSSGLKLLESWGPVFILGYFMAPEVVGLFGVAQRTSLLAQGILFSFNGVFVSFIADRFNSGKFEELGDLLKTVAGWIFYLSFPIMLLIILFSRDILLLFGSDYAAGAGCLAVLSAAQIINSFGGPLGIMVEMSGRPRIVLMNSLVHFTIQAFLCVLWIPSHGIMGAAFARAVSIAIMRTALFFQVRFLLQMHPFRASFYKVLLSGGFSGLFLVFLKSRFLVMQSSASGLVLGTVFFVLSYGILLYLLGLNEEDKMLLKKIRARLAF